MVYDDAYLAWYNDILQVIVRLQHVIVAVVTGIMFSYFAAPFLADGAEDMTRRTLPRSVKYLILCVAYGGVILIFYFLPDTLELPTGISLVTRTLAGFLLLYAIDRRNPKQKFFLSITFFTFTNLFVRMTGEQHGFLSDWLFSNTKLNKTPNHTLAVFCISEVEYVLFYALVLFLAVWLWRRAYLCKMEELNRSELLLMLIPSILARLEYRIYYDSYQMYADYAQTLIDNGADEVLQNLEWSSWTRFFECALSYLFLLAFLWLFQTIRRITKEQLQEAVLTEQVNRTKEHIAKMEEAYSAVRSLRHDMNHHLSVVQGLLMRGDTDEAMAYLSRTTDEMEKSRQEIRTGHPVTDVVISAYEAQARARGISFAAEFCYPTVKVFDIFDISVILGNALSNAVLNVTGNDNPHIFVRSIFRQNMFLIEVRNTFDGVWQINPDTGFPYSTKTGDSAEPDAKSNSEQQSAHGIGLLNIQSIAKKYHGDVTLERKGGEAVLTVVLQAQ